MAITPDPTNASDASSKSKPTAPWWRRLIWFFGLWGVSVLLIYLVSLLIRWALAA